MRALAALTNFRRNTLKSGRAKSIVAVSGLLLSLIALAPVPANANVVASGDADGSCTQAISPATGVLVSRVGNDCLIQFIGSGDYSWTPSVSVSVRYLVVGGGASGTRGVCFVYWGQGGGGGEVLAGSSNITADGTGRSISVGNGGSRSGICGSGTGNSGENSSFAAFNARGGTPSNNSTTSNSGARGGSSGNGNIGGTGTANGVDCNVGGCQVGGGGGAGGTGNGVNGGVGISSDISGATIVYGSGGAGWGDVANIGIAASGGGTPSTSACDAPSNRGGGGADCHGFFDTGGAGGSGYVAIRYTIPAPELVTPVPSPSASASPSPTNQPTLSISSQQSVNIGSSLPLATSGGAGTGTVTFTASPSNVCTASGTTVTGVSAGDCTITATKSADTSNLQATATKTIQVIAAPDTAPPVIGVISPISPSVALENGTVNISVAVTDQTGVSSVTATVVRNASASVQVSETGLSSGVYTLTRSSGTTTNGVWSVNGPVGIGSGSSGFLISGVYDLVITAVDTNSRTSSSPTVTAAFTVGRQTAAPILNSGTYSPSSIVVGSSLTVSTWAVVYGSEISSIVATIGTINVTATLTRVSGTNTSGQWSATIPIPLSTRVGQYPITLSSSSTNGRSGQSVNLGNVTITAPPPSVTFTQPISNSNVSAVTTVTAQASVASGTSGRISFVCLRIDGVPASGDVVTSGTGTWWSSATANQGPTSNCYSTSNSVQGTAEFKWNINFSSRSNGPVNFSAYVIDSSGSVSPTVTRSAVVNIAQPTISFTTPTANSTQSGRFEVRARGAVASGSTAGIRFVCFKLDGSPYMDGRVASPSSGAWWSSNYPASVGGSGNCWQVGFGGSGEFAVVIDATNLSVGSHNFEAFIQDNSGKVSTWASLPFKVLRATPSVKITSPAAGAQVNSILDVRATADVFPGSTASISAICLKIDGSLTSSYAIDGWANGPVNVAGVGTCQTTNTAGQTLNVVFRPDLRILSNGTHSVSILAVDSFGKLSEWTTTDFSVSLPEPSISTSNSSSTEIQQGRVSLSGTGKVAPGSLATISELVVSVDGSQVAVSRFSSSSQEVNFNYSLDVRTVKSGVKRLEYYVLDSFGRRSSSVSTSINVNNPLPTISIISPTSGLEAFGKLEVEVSVGSAIGLWGVGINQAKAISADGRAGDSSNNRYQVPSNTQLWSLGGESRFSWTVDISNVTTGTQRLIVSVIDISGQVSTAEVSYVVQLPNPIVLVVSPIQNQVVKGKVEIRALVSTPIGSEKTLRFVGIAADNGVDYQPAKAQFTAGRGYTYNIPSKYVSSGISGSQTNFNASWTVDFSKSKPGNYLIEIAAEDSSGIITEKAIRFTVAKPLPVVKILSPVSDQTINGAISLKVNAVSDPATTSKISYIAVSSTLFTPQFLGRSTYSCQLDSKYVCLSVEDLKDYSWTSPIAGWKDGDYTLTVIAVDESGNTGTQSVNFKVSSVAPTVTITSPSAGVISKSSFTVAASAIANTSSGAEIIAVAISDRSATPQFPGSLYGRQVVGLPSDAAIWQVANVKNPSWLLDPSDWSEGDRVINVFAIDSNGKLGQSSITVHVAPEPTWKIDVQGSPVLGKSVPVLVTMTTNIPRRSNPPVVIVLQTSSTSAGPWTDLGQITLDSSGTGSGNVLVSKDFYVRVNHPNLDAVQSGTSAAKRIVSVPDPSRPGGNIGTGEPNEDGSIPRVICTVPPKAKSGAKLAFSCVAENVQDSSQGVSILQQTGSGNKKIGNATIRGSRITGSVTIKAKGNITFRLRGADGKYVPWTSSPFTVKYN